MQFIAPIPFKEALDKLGDRNPVTSHMTSAEWRDVPVALRERAFFSSTVESVRVLQRMRQALLDFLGSARETLPNGQTALKTASRADFVQQMQDFLTAEGIQRGKGGLRDITSERRLGLIFDVQTRQAHDYGNWKQGQDPAILNEFPAQRFIRVLEVKEPRTNHAPAEDQVQLKSNLDFWIGLNKDFGVPWGPWGWGCGHDVEDVDRNEAERLKLLTPADVVQPIERSFNDRLEASTRGLDRDLVAKLKAELGDQVEEVDGALRWTGREPKPGPGPNPNPNPNPTPPPPLPPPTPPQSEPQPQLEPEPTQQVRPTPKDLLPDISSLAQLYTEAATFARKAELIAAARIKLSIPEVERAALALHFKTRLTDVKADAVAGADIVRRYTAPELVRSITVSVDARSGGRAHYSPGAKTVSLERAGGESTAAHELMHAVEHQNPQVLRAAAEFLLQRSEGKAPESLRSLTGANYRPSERAFRDKWQERNGSPYAGKVYTFMGTEPKSPRQIQFTEIMTMGVERLHADPLEFFLKDRDWFNFIVKTLRNL